MKKQTKLAVVLSAAALLAIGASMTSFAKGWAKEDGEWVYLDSDGDRVTSEWKQSNGSYYWLDEDGWMARNQLIDDGSNKYYVNEEGVRVKNQWKSVENEDDVEVNGQESTVLWYYFGDNGKAYFADGEELKKKNINDKSYFFDSEGRMAFGWIEKDNDTYYCGNENQGWAYTGWQYLEPYESIAAEYDDQEWFLFKSSGAARKETTYYTGGRYYTFDDKGVCLDNWLDVPATWTKEPLATAVAEQYASVNGSKGNGWVYVSDSTGSETNWYYLVTIQTNDRKSSTKSVAFNSYSNDGYKAKVIKGKTYLFADKENGGRMEHGLVNLDGRFEKGEGENTTLYYNDPDKTVDEAGITFKPLVAGVYYFNDNVSSTSSQFGQMTTGKASITEDGETSYYYFNKKTGAAYCNILIDGVLYGDDGKRIQADDGNSNMLYFVNPGTVIKDAANATKINGGENGIMIIVSSTGKVRTSGSVKLDGVYYDVNKDTYEAVYSTTKN